MTFALACLRRSIATLSLAREGLMSGDEPAAALSAFVGEFVLIPCRPIGVIFGLGLVFFSRFRFFAFLAAAVDLCRCTSD